MNKQFVITKSLAMLSTLVIMLSLVTPVMARQGRVSAGRIVPATSSQALGPTDPAETVS
jgi:hypothetical protein